jgi:hypothetical protein
MDGILTDGRAGKLWMCKRHEGHALGIILSQLKDGCVVERLLLFREAVNFGEDHKRKTVVLPPTKTKGFVEGTMHDIECDLCDAKRTWWTDKKIAISLLAPMYEKAVRDG